MREVICCPEAVGVSIFCILESEIGVASFSKAVEKSIIFISEGYSNTDSAVLVFFVFTFLFIRIFHAQKAMSVDLKSIVRLSH